MTKEQAEGRNSERQRYLVFGWVVGWSVRRRKTYARRDGEGGMEKTVTKSSEGL